jgi:hypothetical protein
MLTVASPKVSEAEIDVRAKEVGEASRVTAHNTGRREAERASRLSAPSPTR